MTVPDPEILSRALTRFYGPLASARDPARRVGWESGAAHRLRLGAICHALEPVDRLGSVLDAGCGEGALLEGLAARGFKGRYRGEELLDSSARRAEERVGKAPFEATVVVANAFDPSGPEAEAVVCSGAMNTLCAAEGEGGHEAYVLSCIEALWARAGALLVFDLAIHDRHPPGVGIGRARLEVVHAALRRLAPAVSVHEDGAPGEALFVASRHRRRTIARYVRAPMDEVEALLAAGDAAGALSVLDVPVSFEARLAHARALAMLGELKAAHRALGELLREVGSSAPLADAVRVALAPVAWGLGDRRAARAHLEEAAARHDEARAHLIEILLVSGERDRARAVAAAIEDPWMQRELAARVGD